MVSSLPFSHCHQPAYRAWFGGKSRKLRARQLDVNLATGFSELIVLKYEMKTSKHGGDLLIGGSDVMMFYKRHHKH